MTIDSPVKSRPTIRQTCIRLWSGLWSYRTGFCVVFLYIVVASVLASGFGSYLTRTEMAAAALDNGVNIDTLINLIKRKEQLDTEIKHTQEVIEGIDQDIYDRKAQLEKVRQDLRRFRASQTQRMVISRRLILANADRLDPELHPELSDILNEPDPQTLVARFYHEYDTFHPIPGLADTESKALLVDLSDGRKKFIEFEDQQTTLQTQESDAESNHGRAQEMRSWPNQRRDDQAAEYKKITTQLEENSAQLAQLVSLFRVFNGGVLANMVTYPLIFLTLIVTVAAGALGSLVKFSRRLEADQQANQKREKSVTDLLVTLGEGVAAALAIFLFAGAGLLMLSQGGSESRMAELSPYTVAFLAFISGFMAEDAFRRIQYAGIQIFGTKNDSLPQNGKGEDAKTVPDASGVAPKDQTGGDPQSL